MKQNLTEIAFVLDRSGSMSGREQDVIGGFNSLIEKQKKVEGEAFITTVLFDDQYELLHDHVDLKTIAPFKEEYYVRGCTALLDAVGKTIDDVGKRLSDTPEDERPSQVIIVIMTDGFENASRSYTLERVKEMIEHQKSKYSWDFVFLGANIDAISTAQGLGISYDRAAQFEASEQGIEESVRCLGNFIQCKRTFNVSERGEIGEEWKADLKKNEKRKAKPVKADKPTLPESDFKADDGEEVDEDYIRALRVVVKLGMASVSLIQRKCAFGYNHAGRAIEWMEEKGYIRPFDGKAGPRSVLLTEEQFEKLYGDRG